MKPRAALVLLVCLTLLAGFFLSRNREALPLPSAASQPVSSEESEKRPVVDPVLEKMPPDAFPSDETGVVEDVPMGPRLEFSRGKLAWEARIEAVTSAAELSDAAKAKRLLEMIATLPEPAMETAATEAAQRVSDADYAAIALPVVTNPQTHGLVEGVLFADLMDRSPTIMLPALLKIARIPNHPYARYALDNLHLLTGEDCGGDWLKWEATVQKTLAAEK